MRPARTLLSITTIVAGIAVAIAGRGLCRRGGKAHEPGEPAARGGSEAAESQARTVPSDWFFAQRAFPSGEIPQDKFMAAFEQARFERTHALRTKEERSQAAAALKWTQAGPFNIGGRVTAIAAPPGGVTVYLGSANGGVFKSV